MKRIHTTILLSTLVFLLGAAFSVSANVKGATSQKKPETRTLLLDKNLIDDAGKQYHFTLDGNVRRASYEIFIFDKAEFTKKLGNLDKANGKKVLVEITKKTQKTYQPDQYSQSPDGGFRNTYYEVKIIRLVK